MIMVMVTYVIENCPNKKKYEKTELKLKLYIALIGDAFFPQHIKSHKVFAI